MQKKGHLETKERNIWEGTRN